MALPYFRIKLDRSQKAKQQLSKIVLKFAEVFLWRLIRELLNTTLTLTKARNPPTVLKFRRREKKLVTRVEVYFHSTQWFRLVSKVNQIYQEIKES